MYEQELTSPAQSRYHEEMVGEPRTPEQQTETQSQGPETVTTPSTMAQGDILSNPTVLAARENEGNVEPVGTGGDARGLQEGLAEKARLEGNKTTRERLLDIAKTIKTEISPSEVVKMADQVKDAVNVVKRSLERTIKEKPSDAEVKAAQEKFEKLNLKGQADAIWKEILQAKERSGGNAEAVKNIVMSKADIIAQLALQVNDFFEHEKIAPPETDPYRPIRSFEELMTKWVDILEDDRFRPGGEFSLLDVQEYTDAFGRVLTKEVAHPENFLRWIREKIWYYHDFDPMSPIDLFKNIYITAGFRTVNIYEMTVDFSIYFAHRIPTNAVLEVTESDIERANDNFEATSIKRVEGLGDIVTGYYKNYIDPETGNSQDAFIKYVGIDPRSREKLYTVYTEKKEIFDGKEVIIEKPVEAPLADKDQWNSEKNASFNKIKERILYEMWLMTLTHNYDVKYRLEGMPTETKLKEVMGEICGVNLFTKDRDRLLGILRMPATSRRDEIEAFMDGKLLDRQGSLGKAIQRSLAAYYHLAEANAAANRYSGFEDFNPFKAVLEKGDINGSNLFYKSLIRQTLEANFSENIPDVAKELVEELNKTLVQMGETTRSRKDWEKADLIDILIHGKEGERDTLFEELQKRGFSKSDYDNVVAALREKHKDNSELKMLIEGTTNEKKRHLFEKEKFKGKSGINDDMFKKKGETSSKKDSHGNYPELTEDGYFYAFFESNGLKNLDAFAVKFMVQTFDSGLTPDVNVYGSINYEVDARDRVKKAIREVLVLTEKLDTFEAKYAEEWAFTLSYFTGISARNDMGGIGHDAWSKILNTEYYRLRQTSGGNYYGNLESLYGIHRLGVDMFQGLRVKPDGRNKLEKSLYEELVGLKEGKDEAGKFQVHFDINEDIENFDFQGNAMRQFNADHIGHAIDLFIDLTQKHEFNIDKVISEDALGRLAVNHAEMQKMIDSTWKHLRYGFDNRGFLYDSNMYGWWFDETIEPNGQIKRTPHFGLKPLRKLMFSEKLRSMRMYERKDLSGWAKEEGKMARNVFAYLISMQLLEHRRNNSGARLYSADEISLIADAFMHYAARVVQGVDEAPMELSGFFTAEEMYKIFVYGHAILWMLYAKEYGEDIAGGFIAALVEGLSLVMKEIGAGIKL